MCRSAHVGWCGRETYDESAWLYHVAVLGSCIRALINGLSRQRHCPSPIQLAICQLIYTATHTILSHPIVSNPMPVSPHVVACGSSSHHQLHLRPLQQRRWGHLVLTKQTGHRQLQSPHHRGGQEAARRSTLYRWTQTWRPGWGRREEHCELQRAPTRTSHP